MTYATNAEMSSETLGQYIRRVSDAADPVALAMIAIELAAQFPADSATPTLLTIVLTKVARMAPQPLKL